jgi:glycosyltransferase involved in cell wall biosynthesis
MNILFIHQNFPGQYLHLAPALASRGHLIAAIGITPRSIDGIMAIKYQPTRSTSTDIHPWVTDFETKIIRAEGAAAAMLELKARGFTPDVICVHPGWGEALFIRDIFEKTKIIAFHEFYYHGRGVDVGFDPEFKEDAFENLAKVRLKNAHLLLSYEDADIVVTPTNWQKSVAPGWVKQKTEVVFDGVDTDAIRPNLDVSITLNNAIKLTKNDEIITFVNRNLEPYRGWHIFARAIPRIQAARPNAHILIIGGDSVGYGAPPTDCTGWKEKYWKEISEKVDTSRIYFLGHVPYAQFISILQLSSAHIYLTYPFVLSWSLMEAMSTGAIVIGSATPPVEEVIEDGKNGFLVDFFDVNGLATKISEVLKDRDSLWHIKENARQTIINRYDLKRVCLPRQIEIVESAQSRMPTI